GERHRVRRLPGAQSGGGRARAGDPHPRRTGRIARDRRRSEEGGAAAGARSGLRGQYRQRLDGPCRRGEFGAESTRSPVESVNHGRRPAAGAARGLDRVRGSRRRLYGRRRAADVPRRGGLGALRLYGRAYLLSRLCDRRSRRGLLAERPVAPVGGGGAAVRLRAGRRLDARRRPRRPRRRRAAAGGRGMSPRFAPFGPPGPRWYAVEARRPFLEDLAAGVLNWLGEHPPEALSDAVVLLPNRRAARAFTGALARLAGDRPVLLPQVRPLGDLEEDEPPFAPGELGLDLPPAIAPLTRRFEMARMIVEDFSPGLAPLRALEMADALGGFLDSCQLEEIGELERVATLVEGDLAEHWQESARFLGLAVEAWPKRLAAMGLVDPAWRRARLLRLLA